MNTITGTIILINDMKTVGNNFEKRTFVIETEEGKYSQEVEIELFKHGVSLIDAFRVGELVSVEYNVKGRKWTSPEGVDKYFVSLQGWKVSATNAKPEPTPEPTPEPKTDDLPF